jgi:hypothetical protein
MSLEKNEPCGCGCNCGGDTEKEIKLENAKFNASGVKILGSGCPNATSLKPRQGSPQAARDDDASSM